MEMVTTKKALAVLRARGIEVPYPTIALWVRDGRFEGAKLEETERGPVWRIPLKSVEAFTPPERGRPPKSPGAQKRATGQKRAGGGPSKGRKK